MIIAHFYVGVLSFLFGVFVATLSVPTLPTIVWVLFLGTISLLLWRRAFLKKEAAAFLYIGIALVAIALGMLRTTEAYRVLEDSVLTNSVDKEVTITGVVANEPEQHEETTHLTVRTETEKVLVIVDRYTAIPYGEVITVTGKLTKPKSFETDVGRVFNYPGYLAARGITYIIRFGEVESVGINQGAMLTKTLLGAKAQFAEKLRLVLPEPQVGLGLGLLLGIKGALGEELELDFRKAGVIHVVVLSGYNVMLVVLLVLYILGHFLGKRAKLFFGLMAIVLFALLVGLSATVVRASIMAGLLLLMQTTGRTYLVLRGLLLAGVCMVLLNPLVLVYDIGFQLSFMATLGLILLAPQIERLFLWVPDVVSVRSFLVATIATQIAVLPLLLYQMGEISVVSIIVNVLVLPMVPVAMLLTFSTGLLAFMLPLLAPLSAYLAYWSLWYITTIAQWFASVSFASFAVPVFSVWVIPVAYAMLGYGLWFLYRYHTPEPAPVGTKPLTKQETSVMGTGWEIVEETEPVLTKTAGVKTPAVRETEVPIFFR